MLNWRFKSKWFAQRSQTSLTARKISAELNEFPFVKRIYFMSLVLLKPFERSVCIYMCHNFNRSIFSTGHISDGSTFANWKWKSYNATKRTYHKRIWIKRCEPNWVILRPLRLLFNFSCFAYTPVKSHLKSSIYKQKKNRHTKMRTRALCVCFSSLLSFRSQFISILFFFIKIWLRLPCFPRCLTFYALWLCICPYVSIDCISVGFVYFTISLSSLHL